MLPPNHPVVKVAKTCLIDLKWPSQNQGHMTNIGINRLETKMSKNTLSKMARTCDFNFKDATADAEVVIPMTKPKIKKNKNSKGYATSDVVFQPPMDMHDIKAFDTKSEKIVQAQLAHPAQCHKSSAKCNNKNSHWWRCASFKLICKSIQTMYYIIF